MLTAKQKDEVKLAIRGIRASENLIWSSAIDLTLNRFATNHSDLERLFKAFVNEIYWRVQQQHKRDGY